MSFNDFKQPALCPLVLVLAPIFAGPYDFYLLPLLLNISTFFTREGATERAGGKKKRNSCLCAAVCDAVANEH